MQAHVRNTDIPSRTFAVVWLAPFASRAKAGGADRDRTDDLKLAKLALSQLSYGPRDRRSADRGSAAQVGLPGVARGQSSLALRAKPGGPGTS